MESNCFTKSLSSAHMSVNPATKLPVANKDSKYGINKLEWPEKLHWQFHSAKKHSNSKSDDECTKSHNLHHLSWESSED